MRGRTAFDLLEAVLSRSVYHFSHAAYKGFVGFTSEGVLYFLKMCGRGAGFVRADCGDVAVLLFALEMIVAGGHGRARIIVLHARGCIPLGVGWSAGAAVLMCRAGCLVKKSWMF